MIFIFAGSVGIFTRFVYGIVIKYNKISEKILRSPYIYDHLFDSTEFIKIATVSDDIWNRNKSYLVKQGKDTDYQISKYKWKEKIKISNIRYKYILANIILATICFVIILI